MNFIKNHISAIWLLLVAFPLIANAQNNRSRWDFSDYYLKNYFFDDLEDQEYNDCIGEAVFYMRKADVTPLRNLSLEKNDTN